VYDGVVLADLIEKRQIRTDIHQAGIVAFRVGDRSPAVLTTLPENLVPHTCLQRLAHVSSMVAGARVVEDSLSGVRAALDPSPIVAVPEHPDRGRKDHDQRSDDQDQGEDLHQHASIIHESPIGFDDA